MRNEWSAGNRGLIADFSRLPLPCGGTLVGMGVDLLLVCASFVGAHLLRFGGTLPASMLEGAAWLPVIGILKVAVFSQFRLYRGLWAHAGTPDAVRLVQASTLASGGLLLLAMLLPGASLSIALLVLDWMLTTLTTGAHRFGRRVLHHHRMAGGREQRRVLIYGADAYGVLLLRYLRYAAPTTSIVGFLDPDHGGRQLRGHPIVDTPAAVDADALIVPVLPSVPEDDNSSDNHTHVVNAYAPMDLSCHRFKLAMDSESSVALPKKCEEPFPEKR